MLLMLLWSYQGLKIQQRGRQQERQNNKRFNKQNNKFARASRFFVHFFPVFARLLRETECLVLRFMEDVNKQRRNFTVDSRWLEPSLTRTSR